MRRREFITLVGGAVAWPRAASAQQSQRIRRVGVLVSYGEKDPEGQYRTMAFSNQLEALGWSVGRNLQIEYRWVTENHRSRAGAVRNARCRSRAVHPRGVAG